MPATSNLVIGNRNYRNLSTSPNTYVLLVLLELLQSETPTVNSSVLIASK